MLFNFFLTSRRNFLKYSLVTGLTCISAISINAVARAQNNSSAKIVTTFLPIHLFTQAVVGDTGQVDILISPGTEVHDYQATPDDVKTLGRVIN